MEHLLTRSPSFSSSPRMRSAPQVRFSLAICLMSATTSSAKGGLPGRRDLDLRLHTQRNKSRCQRSTVSGCTMTSACFYVGNLLASSTNSERSRQDRAGRFTCRASTISCWRRSMFSNTSSGLLRVRSMAVLRTRRWLSGFVHRRRRRLTAWNKVPIFCRTKGKGDRLMLAFPVGIKGHDTTT